MGELPLHVQVKLLRALQERRARRVGGSADIAFSARVIAATNRDLEAEVKAGRFREDLFYRLNVIQLRMPPLRERRSDIPVFLEFFLQRFTAELGRSEAGLLPRGAGAPARLAVAGQHPRARQRGGAGRDPLRRQHHRARRPCPRALRGAELRRRHRPSIPTSGIDLQAHLDALERRALEQALERTGGNKTEAAKLLALTFRSLRYRLAKFGIGEGG